MAVRSLQRKMDRLSRSIDPVVVSTALFAAEIVDKRTWEEARKEGVPHYDRCLTLMEAVLRSTEAKPEVFEEFCEILEREATTTKLAGELRATLQELEKDDAKECAADDQKKNSETTQEDKENLKTNRHHEEEEDILPSKKQLVLMEGAASDEKRLMDISWEVSDKWEEVGVALGLEYKVLQSVVGSEQGSKVHMKAFYMLREWRRRLGIKATYAALAKALEDSGLVGCAQQYCYQSTS